jgi:signal transduction histidine kinase
MVDTPDRDTVRTDAPTATRTRDRDWRVVVPSVFLLLVLAALVVLPFVNATAVQSAHAYVQQLAEPARAAVTSLHVAMALEGSLLGEYVEARDSALLRRYRVARDQDMDATRRLAPLAGQLGASVRARFSDMERMQEAWHRSVEQELAAPRAPRSGRARDDEDEYEDVLLATARLDEAIAGEADRMRRGILDAERRNRRVSVTLALLGFAGAGAVVWLARRLQLYATAVEERGAQLREANEGRARLLRGISHDLKNPLHAIDGNAQLLQDGILGPLASAQQDSVGRMRRGVRSVVALIEDLLELSRTEAGQLNITRSELDVVALVREVVAEHEGAARAAGHRLIMRVPDDGCGAVTDAERVRQVLGNLLSNAVKYTPGCGEITVDTGRRQRPEAPRADGWVAVEVRDTGPGVPEHQQEAIFAEFSRLPGHEGKPGVGLGLAIARRVARLLDGDLTVRNAAPESGACFTLWLPASHRR